MNKVMFLFCLSILIASCTKEDNFHNPKDENEIEMHASASATDIALTNDLIQINFDGESFVSQLVSGKAISFAQNAVIPTSSEMSFTFTKNDHNLIIEDAPFEYQEYTAINQDVNISVRLIDKKYFWITFHFNGEKFVITNNANDFIETVAFKDNNYIPIENEQTFKSNSTYEVGIFIYADKAYRDAETPWELRSSVFYLMDAYNDAVDIVSSQVPVQFKRVLVWSPIQPWSANASIGEAHLAFKNGLSTDELVWLPRSIAKMRATDIHVGITGFNLSGSLNTVWSISPIVGYCNTFSDAVFMEGTPTTPVATKRRLASLICNSLGAKLNYSTDNILNPTTRGDAKEYLLESSRQQIIDRLESSSCVELL